MYWTSKTAFVAGGLGGIGYATCNALLTRGVQNLGIFDLMVNQNLITKLVNKFPASNIQFWKLNAKSKDEVERGFRDFISEFKTIDAFINCVGLIDELNPQRCIEINLLSTIYMNFAAMEHMSKSKGGSGGIIANVASVAGLEPFPLCVVYAASKHGIVGFTRSLGTDFYFKTTGIEFVTICPGFTNTPLLDQFSGSLVNNKTKAPNFQRQTPEICGSLIVDALERSVNGSVWSIKHANLEGVVLPKM